MPGESRTSPRRIDAVAKQHKALALRYSGATFDAIAQELGYANRQGAHMAVEAALQKTIQEPADELRQLDEVAYVRYASVYRRFRDVSQFMIEVQRLQEPIVVEQK